MNNLLASNVRSLRETIVKPRPCLIEPTITRSIQQGLDLVVRKVFLVN